MTWSASAVVLLLVLSCCRVADTQQCDKDGPGDCSFQYWHSHGDHSRHTHGTWCDWTTDGGWGIHKYESWDHFAGLQSNTTSAFLTSRNVCSTKGQTHCLHFQYYFNVDRAVDLKMYVSRLDNGRRFELLSLSSSNDWNTATVPIVTDFDFWVEFQATRRPNSETSSTVYIDTIRYDWSFSCNFNQRYWCGWTPDGGWTWYPRFNHPDTYLEFPSSSQEAHLFSRQSCSTQRQTYCLSFLYYIHPNDSIELNVYLRDVDNGGRQKIWSPLSIAAAIGWNEAVVPIKTDFAFVVEIEAVRLPESSNIAWIWIDDVEYKHSSECSVQPPHAEITTTTSTMTTVTSSRKQEEDSTNIGAVVAGAIVAAAVIVIVVVLFILYRKNKLQTFKNLFKKQEPGENFHPAVAHNVAYNPDAIGIEDSAVVGVNEVSNEYVASENSRQSSVEYYSAINSDYGKALAQNSSTSDGYAVVNKPQGAKKQPNQPASSTYYIPDATGGIYHIPQEKNAEVSSKQVSQTTDEYNELDFDRARKGVQEDTDGEAGAVYSHLREGDEDAYNEVDRERRTDVIDDEYSHTQHS